MNDITVILNRWRRPQYLEEQVKAIESQSVKPKQIWLWDNGHPDSVNTPIKIDPTGKETLLTTCVLSTHNFKYHGRFALGLLASTEWVAFFDDDTIPGINWFKNCIDSYNLHPGIYGGVGIVLGSTSYMDHYRVGWPTPYSGVSEADLIGHAWFMKRKDLSYLWYETPISLENGEDIQLSYLAQKYGGLRTYCPPHPLDDKTKWSSLKPYEYGVDAVASSCNIAKPQAEFFSERDLVVRQCIRGGWKTIRGVKI